VGFSSDDEAGDVNIGHICKTDEEVWGETRPQKPDGFDSLLLTITYRSLRGNNKAKACYVKMKEQIAG
jgi:hypothetical protein